MTDSLSITILRFEPFPPDFHSNGDNYHDLIAVLPDGIKLWVAVNGLHDRVCKIVNYELYYTNRLKEISSSFLQYLLKYNKEFISDNWIFIKSNETYNYPRIIFSVERIPKYLQEIYGDVFATERNIVSFYKDGRIHFDRIPTWNGYKYTSSTNEFSDLVESYNKKMKWPIIPAGHLKNFEQ